MVMGITTSLAAGSLMAGPTISIQVGVPVPPPVVVLSPPPAPAVTVEVGVPDYYVWNGFEFVGVIGGGYFYLGPGHVWIACDPVRLGRFHDYERVHPDWHGHAVVNERYRRDARGNDHPWHKEDHGH
jgi:hypothetical protein